GVARRGGRWAGPIPGAFPVRGHRAGCFFGSLVAPPEGGAPRLVFADWLEEQGDNARAEFIRVQLERARLPEWDARQVPLRLREEELIKKHGGKWKGELPDIQGVRWGEDRRGVPGEH